MSDRHGSAEQGVAPPSAAAMLVGGRLHRPRAESQEATMAVEQALRKEAEAKDNGK